MITRKYAEVPVIIITGVDEVKTAVKCMRHGAFDYMVKPVDQDRLLAGTRRAIEIREMRRENSLLKEHLLSGKLTHPEAFSETVTASKSMHAMFQYVEAIAGTPQPILITGETGVGKELVAKAIHRVSNRKGAFVPVNIAGLDDNVFSDTLFGHIRGAFTGATDTRKGLIEQASGGTLFLDEIGELNPTSQVKLLRLAQEREYFPLGADTPRHTNAGLVVATNKDLQTLQSSGQFREDLYFRLRAHYLRIPPLRERLSDLPLLVNHFLEKASKAMGKKKPTPPKELLTLLSSYHFPGNVRELEAMFFNAVGTHKSGVLSMDAFKEVISEEPRADASAPRKSDQSAESLFHPMHPLPSIKQAEQMLISEAMLRTDRNQTLAAQLLGITRQTLSRHLKQMKS